MQAQTDIDCQSPHIAVHISYLELVFSASFCAAEGYTMSSEDKRYKANYQQLGSPDLCEAECLMTQFGDKCVAWTWRQSSGWCELYWEIEWIHGSWTINWKEDADAYSMVYKLETNKNYDCPSEATTGTMRANPPNPLYFLIPV